MSRASVIELAEKAGLDVADVVEYWEERAAIRELDGEQDRVAAERGALEDIRELIAIGTWTFARKGPRSVEAATKKRGREAL